MAASTGIWHCSLRRPREAHALVLRPGCRVGFPAMFDDTGFRFLFLHNLDRSLFLQFQTIHIFETRLEPGSSSIFYHLGLMRADSTMIS
jgi:hypothetical protein